MFVEFGIFNIVVDVTFSIVLFCEPTVVVRVNFFNLLFRILLISLFTSHYISHIVSFQFVTEISFFAKFFLEPRTDNWDAVQIMQFECT